MTSYTVVGCYDSPEEGDFVEFVTAITPEGAINAAVLIDSDREDARIVAVFVGHLPDVGAGRVGEPRYGRDF